MFDNNEKHLPASQKRLDDARLEGNVPRSREVSAAMLPMQPRPSTLSRIA